jgi:hypothetical protein
MNLIVPYDTAHGIVQRVPEPPDTGTQLIVLLDNDIVLPETPFLIAIYPAVVTPLKCNTEIARVILVQESGVGTHILTLQRKWEGELQRSILNGYQVLCEVTYDNLLELEDGTNPVLSAEKLATPRLINGKLFDGTENIDIYNAIVKTLSDLADVVGLLHNDGSGALSWSKIAVDDIIDAIITYTKIQNISATSRILGRITAGAGSIEELTAANVKTILALAKADISGLADLDSPTFAGLALGSGNLTITGSLAATANRILKAWLIDLETTNVPTIGGVALGAIYAAIAQVHFVGTTSIAANRTSAAQALTGITGLSGAALELPHIIKKVASANIRNSHDAEKEIILSSYTWAKTITLPNGLIGQVRVLFDLKVEIIAANPTAYGKIYHNGVALGTEQSNATTSYVTKSEDITHNFNPGDTIELWLKYGGAGSGYAWCQNFRLAYDDGSTIAVAVVNS